MRRKRGLCCRREVSKRVDVFAAALFNEMTVSELNDADLSYTPPLSTPWDAVQVAAQVWMTNCVRG
mgnify:CR=1 FL=1